MTIASIWIFWSILTPLAGDRGLSRETTDVPAAVFDLFEMPVEACWDRGDRPDPGRDDPSSFLIEEEDEDDTFDDAPPASGHGRDSAAPPIDAAGPCAGQQPARAPCRSALPTLRLRC